MNSNLCVMVVSCDAYSDAWKPFKECFNMFWDDCAFPRYFVINEKETSIDSFHIINTGPEKSWSSKVRKALESIDEEYIFFLLEDYFIVNKVDNSMIFTYLNYLESHNSGYISFFPVKGMTNTEHSGISLISNDNIYGKVLQPSIWKKSYLQECLFEDDFSAWEFEARQKINSPKRIEGKDYCTQEFPIKWENGIIQGKWFPPALKHLKKLGISVDTESRETLSWFSTKKQQIRSTLFGLFSVRTINKYKKALQSLGFKFVTK